MTYSEGTPTPEKHQPVKSNLPTTSANESIPDWLLDFARTPPPETSQPQPDDTQQIILPSAIFSDQERSVDPQISDDIEIDEENDVVNAETFIFTGSIWDKEDAVQLGTLGQDQTFIDPVDELKILLDGDPHEAAEFIRDHLEDAGFKEHAVQSLRAYLTLDPKNDILWQIFQELQQTNPREEV